MKHSRLRYALLVLVAAVFGAHGQDDLDTLLGDETQSPSQSGEPEPAPARTDEPAGEAGTEEGEPPGSEKSESDEATAEPATVETIPLAAEPAEKGPPRRTTIEEIVVTANFREENLQDIAGSIAGYDKSRLEELGINDIADVVAMTASLNNNDRGPGRNDMNIRGIGRLAILEDSVPATNSIGLYLDDVSINNPSSSQPDMNFWGIDRVEVLRGAQSTLYGESSEGGAIRFISESPDYESFSSKISSDIGSRSYSGELGKSGRASVNIPFADHQAGLSLFAGLEEGVGYIDNIKDGANDVNGHKIHLGRAVIKGDLTDKLVGRLAVHYQNLDVGAGTVIDDDDGMISRQETTKGKATDFRTDRILTIPLKFAYDFSTFALESISGYFKRDARTQAYNTSSTVLLTLTNPQLGENAEGFALTNENYEQRTQEFRFISQFESPLSLVAAVYYKSAHFHTDGFFAAHNAPNTLSTFSFEQEAEQSSPMVELSWASSDTWTATIGARYHHEVATTDQPESEALGVTIPPSTVTNKLKKVLPMMRLEWRPNDDMLFFARYATGVRNGSANSNSATFFNQIANNQPQPENTVYKDDFLKNYELGAKLTLLDGSMVMTAGAFKNDWKDLQVLLQDPFFVVVNAGEASSSGFEAESLVYISDHWSTFLNGTYADAKIDKGFQATSDFYVKEGTKLPYSQEYSFSGGLNYHSSLWNDLPYSIRTSFSYIGPHTTVFAAEPREGLGDDFFKMGDYALANLILDIGDEPWKVTLKANNVLNTIRRISRVDAQGDYEDFSGGVPPPEPMNTTSTNSPRSISLLFSYEF